MIKDQFIRKLIFGESRISNQEIVAKLKEEDSEGRINITKLSKTERKEKFHEKRREMRLAKTEGQLDFKYRKDVTIGLKKCLKGLSIPGQFCALLFDSSVNLEPMRCLFEKGQKPPNGPVILGIHKLGELVRKPLGFPAVCVAFAKYIVDERPAHHFYPIVQLLLGESSLSGSRLSCDIAADSKEDLDEVAPTGDNAASYADSENNAGLLRTDSDKKFDEIDKLIHNTRIDFIEND